MARILLAEDDDSLRHFLARSLEKAGHEVIAFADGEDALPVLGEPFDILVSDLVMPNIGGMDLAQRMTKSNPELPIIFITGFAAVAVEAVDKIENINQVISKPFHLNSLVVAVQNALEKKAAS
jgi:two-component system, cell cycle response regulator CpdR